MIGKEVAYDSAIQAWNQLLDSGKLTPKQERDARWQRAGLQAEKDMAYHLRVFFADRKPFAVFNNLKIEHNGLSTQIDHLVLTRWTAYFIESKSVSQVIMVNEHGEWARVYNRRYMPIESPVEQSRRHQETLYNFLWANRDQFQGSFLGLTWNIKRLLTPVHFIAISTHGQIKGRGRRKFPDVKKADQIPAAILAYHESLNTGLLSNSDRDEDMDAFSRKSFPSVIEFLLRSNVAQSPEGQVQAFIADLPQKTETPSAGEREATVAESAEDTDESVPSEAPSTEAGSEPTCPLCGGKMTLRTARRGKNAGSQFWGCTTFPKCRGIVAKD